MRNFSETKGRKVFARLAVIGIFSGMVSACSSDAARFAGFSEPQVGGYPGQPPAPEVTGSLGAAPAGRFDAAPQPGYGQPGYGQPGYSQPGYSQPGYGQSGYGQPGSDQQAYGQQGRPGYGAPSSSYASQGGAQPLYGAQDYARSAPPAPPRMAAGGAHVVQAGETLNSVARMYSLSPAELGAANNIAPGKTVRTGQTLIIPAPGATAVAAARPAEPPRVAQPAPAPKPATTVAAAPAPAPVAKPAPAPAQPVVTAAVPAKPTPAVARQAAPEPKVETAAKVVVADPDDAPRAAGNGPQFRAPVRGRVISSFGPKPGGAHNDGVNFAVPEGTSIRAAEDGVVAYAGNELKGYGNLVLIKHADGYVTAYAHASELDVKRGDAVRRGQIIAKAGQSGNVQSPQLHFEIRKGSTAVDPGRYVAGL